MGKILVCLILLASPLLAKQGRGEITSLQKQRMMLLLKRKHLLEELTTFERTIHELSVMIQERKGQITQHQEEIAKQLPLLIRLARANPLRLLVDSAASQNAIRGTILVRALTTSLKRRMRTTQAELNEITSLTQGLKAKSENHLQRLQAIETEQAQLKSLETQKMKDWKQKEIGRLECEDDINALLEESQATHSKADEKTHKATRKKGLPFSRLEKPVAGKIIKDSKLQKKFSSQSKGILFKTKKNAEVLAPAKGKVVFKGPFRSQGEVLIIDHGKHVHTVLMGMHKINAEVGQNVYAGQKLGKMASYGAKTPYLYLELRQKGRAIDPTPYIAN